MRSTAGFSTCWQRTGRDLRALVDPARSIGNTVEVQAVVVREFRERDREPVTELWRESGLVRPWNDPNLDIDRKLAVDDGMFFVADLDELIVGTLMAGYDGHRGWINYLAVDPQYRSEGVGRLLMESAEQRLDDLGCAKINLQVRADNVAAIGFYERLGFSVDDVLSMGRRLVDDTTPER